VTGRCSMTPGVRWRKPDATQRSGFYAVPSEEILQRLRVLKGFYGGPILAQRVSRTAFRLPEPLECAVRQIAEARVIPAAGRRWLAGRSAPVNREAHDEIPVTRVCRSATAMASGAGATDFAHDHRL
jgi:hypothetical protein